MEFSLLRALRMASASRPRLVCSAAIWSGGVAELRRRAAGRQESGAFLLGVESPDCRQIRSFLFYDDVDPRCFDNGIVEFDGRRFGAVWARCRAAGWSVVADVHVHPGGFSQSSSDRRNPMIPEPGHFALIIPFYARGRTMPGHIGIHEYLGGRRWRDHSALGSHVMRVGWFPW